MSTSSIPTPLPARSRPCLPSYDGVATIALDHPKVRAAIDDAASRGVRVVTLVSDAPSSRRLHYVGIDNPAAGRTAAALMGRFLRGRRGSVGVIAGSLALRDHAERQFGFHQILSSEYPELSPLAAVEGRDDNERTRMLAARLLSRQPDLVGLYSVGAGNRGIAAALEASGRAHDIVWIAHELTVHTRALLLRGVIDAIINQDPGHEARSAARVLLAHCLGDPVMPDQERINSIDRTVPVPGLSMQFHLNGFEPGDPEISEPAERVLASPARRPGSGGGRCPDRRLRPGGLTLAAQLSAFPDIKTCIVEQKPGRLLLGQADGVACRTMEMFHAYGFSERVLKEACWINETTFWKPDDGKPENIVRSGRVQDVEDGLSEFPHVVLNQARVHDCYLDVMRKSPAKLEPYYARRLLDLKPHLGALRRPRGDRHPRAARCRA
jgi:hypothetical protein